MKMLKKMERERTYDDMRSKTTVSKFELYYAYYIKYKIQIILWQSEGTLPISHFLIFSTYFQGSQVVSELSRVFQTPKFQNKGVGVGRLNVYIPLFCYNI